MSKEGDFIIDLMDSVHDENGLVADSPGGAFLLALILAWLHPEYFGPFMSEVSEIPEVVEREIAAVIARHPLEVSA